MSASIIAKKTDNMAELKQNLECKTNNMKNIQGGQEFISKEPQDIEESKNEDSLKKG